MQISGRDRPDAIHLIGSITTAITSREIFDGLLQPSRTETVATEKVQFTDKRGRGFGGFSFGWTGSSIEKVPRLKTAAPRKKRFVAEWPK